MLLFHKLNILPHFRESSIIGIKNIYLYKSLNCLRNCSGTGELILRMYFYLAGAGAGVSENIAEPMCFGKFNFLLFRHS